MKKKEKKNGFSSARVVTRLAPDVEGLGHVARLLHAFLFPDISLVEAVKHNSLRLFLMTLHSVDNSNELIHHQKLQQYRYAMQLVPTEMTVQEDALTALKLLYERYPDAASYQTTCTCIDGVIQMGYLPALQWLFASVPSAAFAMRIGADGGYFLSPRQRAGTTSFTGWWRKILSACMM